MTRDAAAADESGPGAPGALSRAVRELEERVGAASMDRLWVFPPLRRGRKEWGLLALSRFREGEAGAPDRALLTLRYAAELTGRGLDYFSEMVEEGATMADRLPRVMDGVVRRAGEVAPGEPRLVEIGGSDEALRALVREMNEAGAGERPGHD